MAGLYLVGAWLVVQVAGTILPMFGAPAWLPRSIVLLLALGFLPALAFAWAFELTPDGLKRDAEVAPEASIAPQTAQRMDRLIIAVLLLALGYFAVDKFVLAPGREARVAAVATQAGKTGAADAAPAAAGPSMGKQSIAVLPFTDLSPTHDQEYFSDGIAEEILNALAQVKGLKVAGRTSSFQYKGRSGDLRAIARALGVAHVLEGSVRKQGDKVRITAQLIQASDGSHLFSQSYDGDLDDVFELQESIARKITDQLQVVLEGEQKARLVPVASSDPVAYDLYLQATAIFDRRDGPSMPQAVAALEEALRRDPKFARAESKLAVLYCVLPTYIGGDVRESVAQVRKHAAAALALDPTLAEPHTALGLAADTLPETRAQAPAHFERALQLEPDDPLSNFWHGLNLLKAGYIARGTAQIERTLALDPSMPNALRWRGNLYLLEGDTARAEPLLRRARALGLRLADRELSEIANSHGDRAGARKLLLAGLPGQFTELPPDGAQVLAAGLYGDAADRARSLAMIEAALARKPRQVSGMIPLTLLRMGEPARALVAQGTGLSSDDTDFSIAVWFDAGAPLRALPAFGDYLRRQGYVALWDVAGPPDLCTRRAPGDYACH
jgi:TolB-like protein/Tfp pilus assembly protein PilF